MTKVVKRTGERVEFDENRIIIAIEKAMTNSISGIYVEEQAEDIAGEIYEDFQYLNRDMNIREIEDLVFEKLVERGNIDTAREYLTFKSRNDAIRKTKNSSDEAILSLVNASDKEQLEENSNKNPYIASTQRDLIAGEVSKDIFRRRIAPPNIIQAHDMGVYHIHDMDYIIQPIFNCCLFNLVDMLDNGTVINGKMVETPKSFQVACTVTTQIIAQVASNQLGGQSINIKHLGKYVRRSYDKHLKDLLQDVEDEKLAIKLAQKRTKKEIRDGVQTIQYQLNTLMTSNGQAPFVTLFTQVEDSYEYKEEVALIIEEILKQRIKGIKNEVGVHITPAFPKLIYVLDENNIHENSEYYYLTKLSIRCTAKRMYPDYISAKKMKEIYEGNVFSPMGCRAFLSPWKDENGEYKFEGRFNVGVVSINLPQIGILTQGDEEEFWKLLEHRLKLVKEALLFRHKLLRGVKSDVSPVHWQFGALARLDKGETIDKFLFNGYSTLTLGYIGIYELTKLIKGVSHTTPKGREFALSVVKFMKSTIDKWTEEENIKFALYGTPAESLTHRFCKLDKEQFGEIKDITDKGYYTNSYHVDVREEINAFDKLSFESEFQTISTGGCISYVEIPNMNHNLKALETMVKYIYDNIQYAEFNTKSDYCHICGFDGEIVINQDNEWECPQCHNKDKDRMNVTRRTCGYLGENFWNEGRTKEIKDRVLHI